MLRGRAMYLEVSMVFACVSTSSVSSSLDLVAMQECHIKSLNVSSQRFPCLCKHLPSCMTRSTRSILFCYAVTFRTSKFIVIDNQSDLFCLGTWFLTL